MREANQKKKRGKKKQQQLCKLHLVCFQMLLIFLIRTMTVNYHYDEK